MCRLELGSLSKAGMEGSSTKLSMLVSNPRSVQFKERKITETIFVGCDFSCQQLPVLHFLV